MENNDNISKERLQDYIIDQLEVLDQLLIEGEDDNWQERVWFITGKIQQLELIAIEFELFTDEDEKDKG